MILGILLKFVVDSYSFRQIKEVAKKGLKSEKRTMHVVVEEILD